MQLLFYQSDYRKRYINLSNISNKKPVLNIECKETLTVSNLVCTTPKPDRRLHMADAEY